MLSSVITIFIAAAGASILPYEDQTVFRITHDAEKGMSGGLNRQCAGASSVQADIFSISQLEMTPDLPGDDFLHFTPINSHYSSDVEDSQLSHSTKILLEHKINGREGGVFFEFCEVSGPVQQTHSSEECPPEKGDAVAEVLDWILYDMPAANYPFRYVSETPEGTGMFCVNGTTWDDRWNVQTQPEQLEL